MKSSLQRKISVGTSSGAFLSANPRRVGMIVSSPSNALGTAFVTLSFAGDASDNEGIVLYPNTQPLELRLEIHGDLVQRAWTAKANGFAADLGVVEIFQ